jgi:hypothetical protein
MKTLLRLLALLALTGNAFAGNYIGDYNVGDTVDCNFGTVRPSTGASFTLAGSPVISAYIDKSTTQLTAGITLTADFDSVTGMNHVRVVASGGNGYAAGTFVSLIITTGTVDSISVTGQEVCSFTLRKGTITGVPAATAGAAGGLLIAGTNADFDVTANASFAGGVTITQSTSNTAALVVTGNGTGNGATITSGSGATGNGLSVVAASTNGNGYTSAGTGTGSGDVVTGGATGHGMRAVGGATSGSGISAVASTSGSGIVATGVGTTQACIAATGGSTSSAGISATGGGTGSGILATSGSGATGNGISATAASTNGNGIAATGVGTGAGELATAGATGAGVSYVGGATSGNPISTTVTNPIGPVPMLGIDESGTAQSATATTIVLRSATSFPDTTLVGSTIEIIGGTGVGQRCTPTAWVNSTDTATCPTWATTPDSTSDYVVWGTAAGTGGAAPTVSQIATAVWQDTTAGDFTTASSIGKSLYTTGATPGATGGLFIAGTNAATTITTGLTTTFTGNLSGSVGSVTGAVGSVTGAVGSIASGGIADASFATTAGPFRALGIVDQGTAQSATATTLVLRSAATFANSEMVGNRILITGGTTGVGQSCLITAYVGSTDTATCPTWATTPTGTITYTVTSSSAAAAGGGLDAAATRAALGMSSANLDSQLSAIDDYVDTEVAAIKAKTDNITFTVSGQVDANVESQNAAALCGVGTSGDKWRACP